MKEVFKKWDTFSLEFRITTLIAAIAALATLIAVLNTIFDATRRVIKYIQNFTPYHYLTFSLISLAVLAYVIFKQKKELNKKKKNF